VAADFGAAAIFEHEVSKRARAEFGLEDDPSVRVHGFSFLLQAISGEYDNVEVEAEGVPVKDTLHDVKVKASLLGAQAPLGDLISGNLKGVRVREVVGEVTVRASDVSRALAANENEVVKTITQVSIEPISEKAATAADADGANGDTDPTGASDPEDTQAGARVCGTLDIGGQTTDLCALGLITLVEQKISFVPKRLEIRNSLTSGELPSAIQNSVLRALTFAQDPGQLPFKVTPTAVIVTRGELTVRGKAQDVLFGGSGG
jgi:hypothetical protein